MPAHPVRVLAAVGLCVTVTVTGCGDGGGQGPLANGQPQLFGQPPGTVVLSATADFGQVVQRLQDAIAANGGAVATVVDHAAEARSVGVEIAPDTLVIGGPQATQVPFLEVDQRAAATLPQHYLVHQDIGGPVTVTYNGSPYVSAVSGIVDPAVGRALHDLSAAIAARATGITGDQVSAPLIDVTPTEFLITVFGSADVSTTVARLRKAADVKPSRTAAIVDLAAGSAAFGPQLRPTTVVFVSNPQTEAPLLAVAPGMGLELPMRFVVWLDDQNRTQIGYPDIRKLAQRYGIPVTDAATLISTNADRIARTAAGLIG